MKEGHELASHGIRHTGFDISDLKASRQALEKIAGHPVTGFRMPRMMKLPESAMRDAGYLYQGFICGIDFGICHETFAPLLHL